MHTVWLDNLFTFIKLLHRLQELGIGGTGTVHTTKTKREELNKAKSNKKGQEKGQEEGQKKG